MVIYISILFLFGLFILLFLMNGNLYNRQKEIEKENENNISLISILTQKIEQIELKTGIMEKKYSDAIDINSTNIQCLVDILKQSNIIINNKNKRIPVA